MANQGNHGGLPLRARGALAGPKGHCPKFSLTANICRYMISVQLNSELQMEE